MTSLEQLETEALEDSIEVPLLDEVVRVKPTQKWPASAIRATREGDFDTWAEKCLVDGDYKIWKKIDPTLDEVEGFFEAFNEVADIGPKESRSLRRSSNSSRPRSKRT